MKPFKFLSINKGYSEYRHIVNECLNESVVWERDYREVVTPFHESGIEKNLRIYHIIEFTDHVEVLFEVYPDNNPHSIVGTNHSLTIPIDEYRVRINVMSYRESYRRTL